MRTKIITLAEVEFTAFTLAKELMAYSEPIPDFGTRFPNILESCLNTPFTKFSRKHLYRGLIGKASILFYLMIKNHPFQNGNKRIAIMTLLVFLSNNNKWLAMSQHNLYNFAVGIARSKSSSRENVLQNIHNTIEKYLTNFDSD
ncbi:type II toxin-antitoxin system death-on-curing family toxin [Candidatus Kaiserbacteria bacterium]|nr:type II toxin-antitoxin system death-on-curing family toxin [Candidatus Kaiserbacteria bacterium]